MRTTCSSLATWLNYKHLTFIIGFIKNVSNLGCNGNGKLIFWLWGFWNPHSVIYILVLSNVLTEHSSHLQLYFSHVPIEHNNGNIYQIFNNFQSILMNVFAFICHHRILTVKAVCPVGRDSCKWQSLC
jgi:hypothetical protein